MKDDAVYLRHVLECIERIEHYTLGGHAEFMASLLIQDGVIRNLQTLGQSVLKLSDALKIAHPEVDWKSIIGLRNVLVHDYLGVSVARIWEIVEHDLPDLKTKILSMKT
ncbi:MAG: DUF86 domain-containing protein [Candidatus Omnitrophica bacterium]|nr:DUF86 domain-containing protein [Candidatus Omnitrophota bacterium]